MQVQMIQAHTGIGAFPTFRRGTRVSIGPAPKTAYAHWLACEIDGRATYLPEHFVADGALTRDYNPTELTQDVGDTLTVEAIVCGWLLATNEAGVTGWIPAEAVISIDSLDA